METLDPNGKELDETQVQYNRIEQKCDVRDVKQVQYNGSLTTECSTVPEKVGIKHKH